jgi:hypothetical protein
MACVFSRMTAYIANHEKKKQCFAKRERELRHLIKHSAPAEKQRVAAERLRAAKMGVFKCRYAMTSENMPHSFSPEAEALSDDEVRQWLEIMADQILEMYGSSP